MARQGGDWELLAGIHGRTIGNRRKADVATSRSGEPEGHAGRCLASKSGALRNRCGMAPNGDLDKREPAARPPPYHCPEWPTACSVSTAFQPSSGPHIWDVFGTCRFSDAGKSVKSLELFGDPYGTRTRVFAVRGRRPGPLDEGAPCEASGHMWAQRPLVNRRRRPAYSSRSRSAMKRISSASVDSIWSCICVTSSFSRIPTWSRGFE